MPAKDSRRRQLEANVVGQQASGSHQARAHGTFSRVSAATPTQQQTSLGGLLPGARARSLPQAGRVSAGLGCGVGA